MKITVALLLLLCACDSDAIDPDPTAPSTSGTGASSATGSSSGGSNAGGSMNTGGTSIGGSTSSAGGTGGVNVGGSTSSTTGSGGSMAALGYENGSRLRAVVTIGSDGSRKFETFHDSLLGADCTFRTATDGTQRCMPSTQGTDTLHNFIDPDCTQPAFVTVCSSFEYGVRTEPVVGCPNGTVSSAVRIGTPTPNAFYYRKIAANCALTNVNGNNVVYNATVMAPSEFVQGTRVIE